MAVIVYFGENIPSCFFYLSINSFSFRVTLELPWITNQSISWSILRNMERVAFHYYCIAYLWEWNSSPRDRQREMVGRKTRGGQGCRLASLSLSLKRPFRLSCQFSICPPFSAHTLLDTWIPPRSASRYRSTCAIVIIISAFVRSMFQLPFRKALGSLIIFRLHHKTNK